MKKTKILKIIIIFFGLVLIVAGVVFGCDKDIEVKKENKEDEYPKTHPDYKELGSQSLKEDQTFENIKYTQNHLSSTSNTYATFTSIVFNETSEKIISQKIEIDFYDSNNNLIGTMPSTIENLDIGASTVIFAIAEKDLTSANTFKVRKVS